MKEKQIPSTNLAPKNNKTAQQEQLQKQERRHQISEFKRGGDLSNIPTQRKIPF